MFFKIGKLCVNLSYVKAVRAGSNFPNPMYRIPWCGNEYQYLNNGVGIIIELVEP